MSLISLLRCKTRKTLFTTPSHGQKFFIVNKFRQFYKYDISETDAHNPQEALCAAQQRAAKIYNTKYTYFLTNGSTSGIIASVLSCDKGKVLLWNNAHPSHLNAVKLAGCEPVFYEVKDIEGWDIPGKVNLDVIADKIPGCKAVIITSPTYEGVVSDIPAIKKLCEKHGARLIVDEAHGALYPFSDNLPQSAVQIADFTIQSLHKTAGGLNPTALLHSNGVNCQSALDMITTTSPSYPLLASIEANVNFLNSKRGRKHIEELIKSCNSLPPHPSPSNRPLLPWGDGVRDPLKVLVKTDIDFFEEFGIEDEKSNDKCKLFLCGIGTSEKKIERLRQALRRI